MKQIFLFLALFFQVGALEWMTDYSKAVQEAQAKQKPLLLFFTETGCPWCKKLDTEALSTPEFAQKTKDSFIFMLVDFPSKDFADQNNRLQQKFNVRGFPTLIILTPDEKQIGITGYRPGGGKEYAGHLLKIVQDYAGYQEKMGALKSLSGPDLKSLYEQAAAYGFQNDKALIAESGLQSDEAPYFILEQIRLQTEANNLNEANALKQLLLEKFPNRHQHSHYNLSVIEFENRYHEMKQNKRTLESTLEPLLSYMKDHEDKENAWRLNMLVSQVLYDNNNFAEALKYAKQSYEGAPKANQSDIAEAISDISAKEERYR